MEHSSQNVICQNCSGEFVIEPDDFLFYEKIQVPPPKWCSHCRFIRKAVFINWRSLYKNECGNCKKSIISMYHPDTGIKAWCVKCYLGDTWDAREINMEYDFSRNFFEQLHELKMSVPHRGLDQNEKNGEGCEYANYCFSSKNIYLSYDVGKSENLKYVTSALQYNKNCMDSLITQYDDRVYEGVQTNRNFASTFLVESDQCIESHFLYDCSNCVNCYMSCNLRNKSYVFKNQQLTKEEYHQALLEEKLYTYTGQLKAKKDFQDMSKTMIHKYANIKNSVNAIGDFIENSKNVYHCYGIPNAENCKYIYTSGNITKDSYDLIATGKLELSYEATYAGRGGSQIAFSISCGGGSKNLFYCFDCRGCSDCFGSVGLSKKQYCIFNTQYSKEDYFIMIEKIKIHMNEMPYIDSVGREYGFGECFPTDLSPFAYNETIAYEEVPLSKEEANSKGYKWRDLEIKSYIATIKTSELEDSILDVPDSICTEVIECPNGGSVKSLCTSAYKILSDELAFYRQMNLPLPRYCPNCRYYQRLAWKNPFRFYKRECMCEIINHGHEGKCNEDFETMYPPEKPEKIYCKKCYQKEVY